MNHRYQTASVHGRFQPLHNEHLEYILAAFEQSEFVFIGITQYQRAHLESIPDAGEHRQEPASNPLTYFERSQLISLALKGEGISADRFSITPFPIEQPTELGEYLPKEVPIFTTRVDDWNDRKTALLQEQGYIVRVLFTRNSKGVSGSQLRRLIREGQDQWKTLVPAATVDYLVTLRIENR